MNNNFKTYIFQTGHGKGLAKMELMSIMGIEPIDETEDGFVIECEIPHARQLIDRMGGAVRIVEVVSVAPAEMPINFTELVAKAIESEVKVGGKIRFGLSMHPKSDKVLKNILVNSKKLLKGKIGNIRFVNKDFQNLSSVQAWHENLLGEGALELHLFKSETKWYLGKTIAIQDFENYTYRDMKRPAKDLQNGMFPPKLAQILINLAAPKLSSEFTIFDPFCGSGTVLQEAILMGFSASGSDFDPKMIDDSQTNLKWLIDKFKLECAEPKVFLKDATDLTSNDLPRGPFAIVTETWLGQMISRTPTEEQIRRIQSITEKIYADFFDNLKRVVPAGTVMVFTAPYHKIGNDRYFVEKLPAILEKNCKIIPLSEHERPSLFYERKDQFVGREIWKLEF